MKVTIDRMEGTLAVVELPGGELISVPKQLFEGAKEGQTYEIKPVASPRMDNIRKLMNEVWDDGAE